MENPNGSLICNNQFTSCKEMLTVFLMRSQNCKSITGLGGDGFKTNDRGAGKDRNLIMLRVCAKC